MITQALVLAAGQAKRMRPLTDKCPKPLIELNGKALLTHIIEHLAAEGVTKIVVNGHHAIMPLRQYMEDIKTAFPAIDFTLSEETELLETGGGAVQSLQFLRNDEPFYMINGDAFWINPATGTTLGELAKAYNMAQADLCLLLQPTGSMNLTQALGDYNLYNDKAIRAHDKNGSHMFTGIRICHPDVLNGYQREYFSFLTVMDAVEAAGQLYGHAHNGEWYHISTPKDLSDVEQHVFGCVGV